MTLNDYLLEVCDTFNEDKPSSIMYHFNGEEKGIEIEDFVISDSSLQIEDDLIIPLNTKGSFNKDDIFEIEIKGEKIGIQFWF